MSALITNVADILLGINLNWSIQVFPGGKNKVNVKNKSKIS